MYRSRSRIGLVCVALVALLTAGSATARRGTSARLTDVAKQVGLDFRQDAFRFGVTADTPAMMGGGLCWLDYDRDGWLDLFVVNSYTYGDLSQWQ